MVKQAKGISIISLLQVITMLFGGIALILPGETSFVNYNTKVVSMVLCLIVVCLLSDAKKNENHPLTILSWWLIFFVILRVITLHYTDYSVCLQRSGATSDDVTKTLIIICVGTILLWWGLHYCKQRRQLVLKREVDFFSERTVNRGVILYSFSLLSNLVTTFNLPLSGLAVIINSYILNIQCVLFILATIAFLAWRNLGPSSKIRMILVFLSYVVFMTIGGSRSGIFTVIELVFYLLLTVGIYRIKRVYLYIILLLVPLMVFIFGYSTYMRQMDLRDSTITDKMTLASDYVANSKGDEATVFLSPVCDRIGFLDYAVEMNVRKEQFRPYINIINEFKSIVDNVLTPGFDIFDVPKMSNIIHNTYYYGGEKNLLSKKANMNRGYHSDELTLFGESILLFGVPFAFLFFFLVGRLVKKIWQKGCKMNNMTGYIIKGLCLYLFQVLLSSFGLDWFVLNVVSFIITYMIFDSFVFESKKKSSNKIIAFSN